MKLRVLALIFLPAALLQQAAWLSAAGRPAGLIPCAVYGTDDRVDYYQADPVLQKLADSTAALFKNTDLDLDEDSGLYRLRPLSLKDKYNLRNGQRFGLQTVGALCSAALVGDDLILTSGHCLKPDPQGTDCERVRFVFGYAVTREGETPNAFSADNVYSCKEIISQRVQNETSNFSCAGGACGRRAVAGPGPDYALVKLDRKVKGRYPLAVSRRRIAAGTRVVAISYPSGLPVKVAGDAKVRSVTANGYFVADLDTFSGSSGGPVFNAATYKIEGVLARGGADYIYGEGTPVEDPRSPYSHKPGEASVYPQDGGRGEDVTLSSVFERLIPKTAMERALEFRVPDRVPRRPDAVPAINVPGGAGGALQPAIYTPPPAAGPEVIKI